MGLLSSIRTLRDYFFRRSSVEREMDEEFRSHIAIRAADLERRGLSRAEAERQARIEFGGYQKYKEECREALVTRLLQELLQDVRYGLRQLRRNPGFTTVAVLTLALGIGANTAIFSVANAMFQRGLPARDPGRILGLSFHQRSNLGQRNYSYPDFEDICRQATSFTDLFAYRIGLDGLKTGDRAEQVITSFVTGNYFTALGLKPALGRLILPREGSVPGSDPVLVLGYSYWKERFGGSQDIIGKQVEIDGRPLTVVGVAPKGFRGLYGAAIDVQAYMPINMFSWVEQHGQGWTTDRTSRSLYVMGRLRTGTTPEQAQALLNVIASRLARKFPKDWHAASIVTYPSEAANSLYNPSRHTYRIAQLATALFLAMAGLLLLLACFNVANVLLVRATARGHEMAVRAALGASRTRLISQILSESILLAILGGAAGLALGEIASVSLSSIHMRVGVPVQLNFPFDWHVFAFALASALVAGIVAGIMPAVRAAGAKPGAALHEGGRGMASGRHYVSNILVVTQLAGSVVLLVVAGLFARSFQKASSIDLGFEPHHVLNISMDPGQVGYVRKRGREFYKDLLSRVRSLPGVHAASLASTFPGSEYFARARVYVQGHLPPPGQAGPSVSDNSVSSGYFETMGIPIVEGRGFQQTDSESAPKVAVINETMAKEFWPDEYPIGKRFRTWLISDSDTWIQIVGVAHDSRVQDLTAEVPAYFYLPLDQNYSELVTLQVRTTGPPERMVQRIENQIRALTPGLPVFGVQTMEQALNGPGGFFHYWLGSVLASVLGLLGLALAVVGVYGVISYSVTQRTHEIGIRMALGAERRDLLKMVVGQGLTLALIGVTIGIAGALVLTRFLTSLLYGVKPTDPVTFIAVSLILTAVALLACYIPARRAAKVDPMVALRYE